MKIPAQASLLGPDDVETVHASFRRERAWGLIACLIGVLLMLAGRYLAGAPGWLTYAGLAIVLSGWGLMALSIARRVALARSLKSRRND